MRCCAKRRRAGTRAAAPCRDLRQADPAAPANIKLSQQQIGSLIGASRESINKHLGEWTRAGYVAVDGGFIVIRDRAILQRIAEADV